MSDVEQVKSACINAPPALASSRRSLGSRQMEGDLGASPRSLSQEGLQTGVSNTSLDINLTGRCDVTSRFAFL